MVIRKKLPVRRGGCREPEPQPIAEGDEIRSAVFIGYNRDECEPVPGDDCEAIVDDPGDEIEEYENEVSEEKGCGVQTEEEACEVFSSYFGDVASNDGDENDESGDDDCWNEDNTPDPASSDDEEEEARREACEDAASADEVLAFGKTFSSASEFKQALLRYSLKTRYDIKLYISTQMKLGAVCCWGQNRSRRNRCPKVIRKTESRSKLQKPKKRIAETDRPASSTMTRASTPGEHDRVASRLAGKLSRDTSQLARRARPFCRSTRRRTRPRHEQARPASMAVLLVDSPAS